MSEFFDDVNFYNGGSSGAPGPVFAALLPTAGKAYVLGNVGVGTINPQNALDVEGALAVGASYSGSFAAPANGLIVEGNVGIGTNTPGAKLDVAGTMQVSQSAFLSVAGGSVGVGTNAPGAKLDVAGTTRVSQDAFLAVSSGSVGIGTSTPVNKLDVSGDVAIQGKHALRGSDSWLRLNQDGAFASGVHTPGNFAPNSLNVGGAGGWGNPGAGNVWVTGRVGLGTQRPLYRLHALAPGGFGGEDANGVSLEGNVPVVAQSDSTAIGILNAQGRQAFALNIDGNLGTTAARGVPTFYDKYDGGWHPSISLRTGNVGIGTTSPSTRLHVAGSSPAVRIADGTQGEGRLLVSDASGNGTWKDNSRYFLSASLNNASITATTTPQKMGDYLTFTKAAGGSAVEVHMNTRAFSGNFSTGIWGIGGAAAVTFEVRVDNIASSVANVAAITASNVIQFVSIFAVFQSLAAGPHTVSVWVSANAGTSTGVVLDIGGWGGRIIVKETF